MSPEKLALDGGIFESTWTPLDLLTEGAAPPEPPTVLGLIYPGKVHLLSGEPEACKSWLAKVACVSEIRGGHDVLYIDLEMSPRDMLERLLALGLSDEEIRDRFIYVRPDEALDGAGRAVIEPFIEGRKPTLVIVDALAGALEIHGLDENIGRDVETFMRTVVGPLQAHGAAVVLLDHVVKNGDARGRWAIGSQRKVGAVDVHLGLGAVESFGRGRTGLVRILTHKDRPGYLPRPKAAELTLISDAHTGTVAWKLDVSSGEDQAHEPAEEWRPTVLMERVVEYLREQNAPVTRSAITANVTGKKTYLVRAIDFLVADGLAIETVGARGAKLVALA